MAALAALLTIHALGAAAPAMAGGSYLYPVRDRYEVGDVVTLVGYTSGGQLGQAHDGPFLAYLVTEENPLWATRKLPAGSVPLGPLNAEQWGPALRVSLSFPLPRHLAPAMYTVTYCNDPCTTGLGDLIGGTVAVGVDAPYAAQRNWFLDDPEVANLADDAVIIGPGRAYTAGDLRAGRVVTPPGWGLGPGPRPRAETGSEVAPNAGVAAGPSAAEPSGGGRWAWELVVVTSIIAFGAARRGRERNSPRRSTWRVRSVRNTG